MCRAGRRPPWHASSKHLHSKQEPLPQEAQCAADWRDAERNLHSGNKALARCSCACTSQHLHRVGLPLLKGRLYTQCLVLSHSTYGSVGRVRGRSAAPTLEWWQSVLLVMRAPGTGGCVEVIGKAHAAAVGRALCAAGAAPPEQATECPAAASSWRPPGRPASGPPCAMHKKERFRRLSDTVEHIFSFARTVQLTVPSPQHTRNFHFSITPL